MSIKSALALSAKDNVAVALQHIDPGDEVSIEVKGGGAKSIQAMEEIPFGFKVALTPISAGSDVIKYGECMGRAKSDIERGMNAHVHNVEGVRARRGGGNR